MRNFEEMYYCLFRAITDAIESLDSFNIGHCKDILIAAQQKTEEIYVSSDDE